MSTARDAHLVTDAFFARVRAKSQAGLATDGVRLTLYENRIAEWRADELWVRVNGIEDPIYDDRGWGNGSYRKSRGVTVNVLDAMRRGDFEFNVTTLAKLSLIPGVQTYRHRNQLWLNGKKWDGLWTRIQHVAVEV